MEEKIEKLRRLIRESNCIEFHTGYYNYKERAFFTNPYFEYPSLVIQKVLESTTMHLSTSCFDKMEFKNDFLEIGSRRIYFYSKQNLLGEKWYGREIEKNPVAYW